MKFLKYFGIVVATILGTLAVLLGFAFYQLTTKMSAFFDGADTYTCGQFLADLKAGDEVSQAYPLTMATLAYGKGGNEKTLAEAVEDKGIVPVVGKVAAKCQGRPGTRILTLFAEEALSPSGTTPAVSASVPVSAPSATQPGMKVSASETSR